MQIVTLQFIIQDISKMSLNKSVLKSVNKALDKGLSTKNMTIQLTSLLNTINNLNNKTVIKILSNILTSGRYDDVTDELADMISRHMKALCKEEQIEFVNLICEDGCVGVFVDWNRIFVETPYIEVCKAFTEDDIWIDSNISEKIKPQDTIYNQKLDLLTEWKTKCRIDNSGNMSLITYTN